MFCAGDGMITAAWVRDPVKPVSYSSFLMTMVETADHDITCHTSRGNFTAWGTMRSVERLLPPRAVLQMQPLLSGGPALGHPGAGE